MQQDPEAAGPGRWTPAVSAASPQARQASMAENSYSLSEAQACIKEAEEFTLLGNMVEAEKKYRYTLARLSALLSPTHEETVSTAYRLAELYAQTGQMVRADRVLNWIGEKHIEYFGAEHSKTILHLMHVSGALFRPDKAQTVLTSAIEISRLSKRNQSEREQPLEFSLNANALDDPSAIRAEGADLNLPGDEASHKEVLSVAQALLLAEQPAAEDLLIDLIVKCKLDPER